MLRWIKYFLFVIIALICIVQNVACISLFDLVGQNERVLKDVVDIISATDCSFNEFKKVVTPLEESKARKVYGIVRTIKELSNITNWFNAVKDSPNTASMEGTYLFAHIAYGHFFSPLHGERSSTKKGKSKYYDEDSAWRINDDLRNAFILPFTVLLSNAFLEIMHGILTKEVASSINIDDKYTVLVSGKNIDNFGLLQNSHVSVLTDTQGAKKAESNEKLSSISIGINFKDDLKQKPDVTYDINGKLNPLAKTLAVLVSQTISKSINQRYFDALFQACVNKIAFPKAKGQPATVLPAGEITFQNLLKLTSIIQSLVSGTKEDEIITSHKSFFGNQFEFPKEIIRSGTLMYPDNSLIFFFEEIASLVFLRNKTCNFNHINLITSLIMSPEALCNFQKQIKRYLNGEKPDAKKLSTELIISNFYPIFGEKKEDTNKEDAERDKDTPVAKTPLESSKSMLSGEAQQVIEAVSKIDYTIDYTKEQKQTIITKLKEAATKKKEGETTDGQISKEKATEFIKWFIEQEQKAFSLLQHSSFAEAFGYTWELANTEGLAKAPLGKYITDQLNLMEDSYNALRQLIIIMGVEYAADSASKPFTFSRSSDISGETLELRKIEGGELKELSPGLSNIGSSCYFNATMQALFATKYFRNLEAVGEAADNMQNALVNLFAEMKAKAASSSFLDSKQYFTRIKSVLSTNNLLRKLFLMNNDSDTAAKKQEDSSELLEKILGVIDEEEFKKYNPSKGKSNIATWLATNAVECSSKTGGKSMIETCGVKVTRTTEYSVQHRTDCKDKDSPSVDEYRTVLQIELAPETSHVELGTLVTQQADKSIMLSYPCEFCNGKNGKKKDYPGIKSTRHERITSWPKTLIITLNRFQVSELTAKRTKIQSSVQYKTRMNKGDKQYHLTAVINHKGDSLDSGHYTAIVREGGKWYEKDDDRTLFFANNDVKFEQNIQKKDAEHNATYTQEAYVLIYEAD